MTPALPAELTSLLTALDLTTEAVDRYDFVEVVRMRERWGEIRDAVVYFLERGEPQERERLRSSYARADRALAHWAFGRATLTAFGRSWVTQTLENAPSLAAMKPLGSIGSRFRGMPAIIVSAGPSLADNIRDLRLARGRSLIIAVNRAVGALQAADIEPDIVVVGDSQDVSPHLVAGSAGPLGALLVRPSCHPNVVSTAAHHKLVYGTTLPHEAWLFETLGNERLVEPGGSVAHAAFGVACLLDCNPLIFVGQDLALKDGAYYSTETHSSIDAPLDTLRVSTDGTSFLWDSPIERTDSYFVRSEPVTKVPGYSGGTVVTTASLHQFLRSFEALVAAQGTARTIINATEGGARIAGTVQMRLRDATRGLLRQKLDTTITAATGTGAPDRLDIRRALTVLRRDLGAAVRTTRELDTSPLERAPSNRSKLLQNLRAAEPAAMTWALSYSPSEIFEAFDVMASEPHRPAPDPTPYHRALHAACAELEPLVAAALRALESRSR